MLIIATNKRDQNVAAIDPWTAVHLAAGLAVGLMGFSFRFAIAGSIAYEVVEQYGERRGWGQRFFNTSRPESFANAMVDTLAVAAGHRLGARWNATGPASGS